jgi:hypothetical protein
VRFANVKRECRRRICRRMEGYRGDFQVHTSFGRLPGREDKRRHTDQILRGLLIDRFTKLTNKVHTTLFGISLCVQYIGKQFNLNLRFGFQYDMRSMNRSLWCYSPSASWPFLSCLMAVPLLLAAITERLVNRKISSNRGWSELAM